MGSDDELLILVGFFAPLGIMWLIGISWLFYLVGVVLIYLLGEFYVVKELQEKREKRQKNIRFEDFLGSNFLLFLGALWGGTVFHHLTRFTMHIMMYWRQIWANLQQPISAITMFLIVIFCIVGVKYIIYKEALYKEFPKKKKGKKR